MPFRIPRRREQGYAPKLNCADRRKPLPRDIRNRVSQSALSVPLLTGSTLWFVGSLRHYARSALGNNWSAARLVRMLIVMATSPFALQSALTGTVQGLPSTATSQIVRLPFASDVNYTASAAWLKIGSGCESCELRLDPWRQMGCQL